MKYEYKVINLFSEVKSLRKGNDRDNDGDEVIIMEIVNSNGKEGWRWVNPGQPNEAYFEREAK